MFVKLSISYRKGIFETCSLLGVSVDAIIAAGDAVVVLTISTTVHGGEDNCEDDDTGTNCMSFAAFAVVIVVMASVWVVFPDDAKASVGRCWL